MVLTCSKHVWKRTQTFLSSPLVCLGLHINFQVWTSAHIFLFWDYVGIQWTCLWLYHLTHFVRYSHWLIQRQPITLCQVMAFLSKTIFCVKGHANHCWFCHVIQSDMLNVYHSTANKFLSYQPSPPVLHQLWRLSQLQQSLVPLQFPLPDMVITRDAIPNFSGFWVFIIL